MYCKSDIFPESFWQINFSKQLTLWSVQPSILSWTLVFALFCKVFLFQILNFYASLIYIAFIKGRAFKNPGHATQESFSKFEADQCDPGGCLYELFLQLAIIMIGKQFFNNFIEIAYP